MNRFLKTVLITSGAMMLLIGAGAAVAGWQKLNIQKFADARYQEELDIKKYGDEQESIEKDTIIPLYMDGANKNVQTYPYQKLADVYDVAYTANITESLDILKQRHTYDIEKPLAAYNPFGTNQLSMYLYFNTREVSYIRYTVHIENSDVLDYTRTAYIANGAEYTQEHEYQITGLVPGVENYIIMEQYDTSDDLIKRVVYRVKMPDVAASVQKQLSFTPGVSKEEISGGLFVYMGSNSADNKGIYLYDNSGYLRAILPVVNYQADSMEFINGQLIYNYSKNGFVAVNELGQVKQIYKIPGYRQYGDFTYDGYGNLFVLASKNRAGTVGDRIVAINLESGDSWEAADLSDLLKDVKSTAKKEKNGKKKAWAKDWLQLNSITMAGSDAVIISSEEMSGIIKVNYITSKVPAIQYILGDTILWGTTAYTDKMFTKVAEDSEENTSDTEMILQKEAFTSHFRQSDVNYVTGAESSDGQYYLEFYNSNYGYAPTRKNIDWSAVENVGLEKSAAANSMYYKYLVDEMAATYTLVESRPVPYSTEGGSIRQYEGHMIVHSKSASVVEEYDEHGEIIRKYNYPAGMEVQRVYKNDMKGFWYQ